MSTINIIIPFEHVYSPSQVVAKKEEKKQHKQTFASACMLNLLHGIFIRFVFYYVANTLLAIFTAMLSRLIHYLVQNIPKRGSNSE